LANRTPSLRAHRCCIVLTAAVLTGLGGCSAGPPQVLRGPPPRKGEASRTQTKMVMEKGKISIRFLPRVEGLGLRGIERHEGTCAMTVTSVEEDEILEVDDRQVTKQHTKFITEDSTQTIEIDGEKDSHTERGPLVGETVLRQPLGGTWKNTLVGKAPTPKQQKELESLPPLENTDDLVPEGAVKPGHTWKIDAARLRKLIGARCTALTGEASMTFERTTTHGGESCALIQVTMNVKGKMLDDDNNAMAIEVTATGTTYQSLKTGYDVQTSLTGTIKIEGTVVREGQRIQTEISGPITLESSTKPK
jgi:hypothetical protein